MGRHHAREADEAQWRAATLTKAGDGAQASHSREDEDADTVRIREQVVQPTE